MIQCSLVLRSPLALKHRGSSCQLAGCHISGGRHRQCFALRRARGALVIESNELNKWGDTDARDDDTDGGEDSFDYEFAADTARIVARVLTARAVQKLLLQLNETDIYQARWLTDYCNANPPMGGDKFVLKLMKERPVSIMDSISGAEHNVSPVQLGHRIMISREAIAAGMKKFDFETYVARTNVEVLRQHLETSSYTSGTAGAERGRRRR